MKLPWFRLSGLLYIPVTICGWLILLAATGYAIFSFFEIDRWSHSVSDTLMNFVFRLVIIFAGYMVFAHLTSKKKSENK